VERILEAPESTMSDVSQVTTISSVTISTKKLKKGLIHKMYKSDTQPCMHTHKFLFIKTYI
jgi:hypothetical protein